MAAAAGTVSGLTAAEIAAGSAAVAVAGTVASAAAQAQQGEAAANAANFRAQVADNNAKILEQNKKDTIARGDAMAEQQGFRSAAQMGAIRAAEGASGVDVDSGSNKLVQKSAREIGQLDAETIRNNAAKEAYGVGTQEQSQEEQAQLDRAEGAYAPIAGDIGAFGTLAGGAGAIGGRYSTWLQASGGGGTPINV